MLTSITPFKTGFEKNPNAQPYLGQSILNEPD